MGEEQLDLGPNPPCKVRNLGNSHPISIQHRKFILFPGKCCPYSFIQKPDYELNKNFSNILGVAGTRINLWLDTGSSVALFSLSSSEFQAPTSFENRR